MIMVFLFLMDFLAVMAVDGIESYEHGHEMSMRLRRLGPPMSNGSMRIDVLRMQAIGG
jgi:hypothetical protein